jgi:hypothetical protein
VVAHRLIDAVSCAHCGELFIPRRRGQLYHSVECRRAGPMEFRKSATEREAIRRLFDESRDPGALVEPGDWYPSIGTPDGDALGALEDPGDTVSSRRARFLALKRRGRA